jgi:hypothetical protein
MGWQGKHIKNVSKELFRILMELLLQGTKVTVIGEYHMGLGVRNWDKPLKHNGRDLKKSSECK